jgi:hypothetical protein
MFGNGGNDTIESDHTGGGTGCDYIDGGDGDDYIFTYKDLDPNPNGRQGGDDDGCLTYNMVYGGAGEDQIFGSDRVDRMWRGPDSDGMAGFGGDDWLCSNCDGDTEAPPGIIGSYYGGDGSDHIITYTNNPNEAIIGAYGEWMGAEGVGPNDQVCYLGNGILNGNPHVVGNPWIEENDCCQCLYESCSFGGNCTTQCSYDHPCYCDCTNSGNFDCTCP